MDQWKVPGLEVEMLAEGMWLERPTDMAKAWPEVWANAKAAKNCKSPRAVMSGSFAQELSSSPALLISLSVSPRPSSPAGFPDPLGRHALVVRLSPHLRYYPAIRLLPEHCFSFRLRLWSRFPPCHPLATTRTRLDASLSISVMGEPEVRGSKGR